MQLIVCSDIICSLYFSLNNFILNENISFYDMLLDETKKDSHFVDASQVVSVMYNLCQWFLHQTPCSFEIFCENLIYKADELWPLLLNGGWGSVREVSGQHRTCTSEWVVIRMGLWSSIAWVSNLTLGKSLLLLCWNLLIRLIRGN